jgi:hypothetical protein
METATQTYLGKAVKETHEFNVEGTFESYYAASKWAEDNGYSVGSMDGRNPIAMMKDYDYVAKWQNISPKDQKMVQAVMISDYFREKPVTILIFE